MTTNKSNIVLIGMPGVGKSTLGVLLAKAAGRYFLDTDVYIQAIEDTGLPDIIAQRGLKGFCEIERSHIERIDIQNTVIATGGSVVYYDSAMQHLKTDGIVVYLYLPLEVLEHRLSNLSTRGVVIDPDQTLRTLYEKRTPLYEQYADVTVNLSGLTHEQGIMAILKAISQ